MRTYRWPCVSRSPYAASDYLSMNMLTPSGKSKAFVCNYIHTTFNQNRIQLARARAIKVLSVRQLCLSANLRSCAAAAAVCSERRFGIVLLVPV